MILSTIYVSALVSVAVALPQDIQVPMLQNFSPPEEVNALQSSPKVQRSISDHAGVDNTEDTIKEVERLIQSNPELPRLTRGEILDILDNITKQDQGNFLNTVSKDSNRDPKALMVVKAYTPLGSGEVNVEEFYTKPPLTSIIDDEEDLQTEHHPRAEAVISTTTTYTPFFRRKPTKSSEDKKQSNNIKKKPSRGNSPFKINTTPTTTTSTTTARTTTTTTERITTTTRPYSTTRRDIKRRRRPVVTTTTTTQMPATTYRPRRRQPPRKEIQYFNHKYPEDPFPRPMYPPEGIRIVRPPATAQSPSEINSELEDLLPQEMENQETFMPIPSSSPVKTEPIDIIKYNSVSEPSIELEIPEHLKKVVADLNLAAIQDPESVSVTSIVPKEEKNEADKIKNILASIGVFPPTASSSTTTGSPNANAVADNLSPDMQELLKSFGLLPNSNENESKNEIPGYNPEKAEIHPESYAGFKPLPEDLGSRKEMEDLLAQFGLLDKNGRNSKSLKKGKQISTTKDANQDVQFDQISLDAVPDNLKPILQEMGFEPGRVGRKIREQPVIKTSEKSMELNEKSEKPVKKQHVFNPADQNKYVSEEEIQKLGRLLEIMKKLEKLNGTITEDDMKQIDQEELTDLINSLNQAQHNDMVPLDKQNAPNPVEYDLGLMKNEVKRQESTTTEKVETVTAESLPEETKTPSIKDLEDSFGGSSDSVTEALPETTTPRRSGFYYLLDWNSFLEIDDQKGKRVNLRFQPKVGDPKRFFSVNVP